MQTQRMYDHHHRPASRTESENLAERVLRVGRTIVDLRRRLATEREMLHREKLLTASMFLLPTSNEYYTLVTPKANGENSHSYENIHPEFRYGDFCQKYDGLAENGLDNLSLTSSEKNYIEREKKLAVLSSVHAYRSHLKAVETKCKLECGALRQSFCNLRRVSTELNLEIAHDQHKQSCPEDEKDFFYEN